MFLSIKKLSKKYGSLEAVKSFSLDIKRGELVSILGPSGCGKTTTLKLLGGFEISNSGSIELDGVDLTELPPEKRPFITIFQNYALFPHMNVLENVAYGLKFKGVSRKDALDRARKILERLSLSEHEREKVHNLSGGQQQRVAIARALILNPSILLLDEPFSSLDAKLRLSMREELKRIQRESGVTMIFVTHDQEEAMSISDKIVVMNDGLIEQTGEPEDIYNHPATSFVRNFIGDINIIENKFVRPERVSLKKDLQGNFVVAQKLFRGNLISYFVENLERKILIRADEMNHGRNLIKKGDRVTLEY